MVSIDINCDMGEGMETDAMILPFISSANVACGYHAGDVETMKRTVQYCLDQQVAIGAHPSFYDRENFGRTDVTATGLQIKDISEIIEAQLHTLQKVCLEMGAVMHHVKPHGALYNLAARDLAVAGLVCEAIANFNGTLILYGLSGSAMKSAAADYRLRFASEVFADRTYSDDGSLTPRSQGGALIADEERCIMQLSNMLRHKAVISQTGKAVPVEPETLCIHGDGRHAVSFAQTIYHYLKASHIAIKAT